MRRLYIIVLVFVLFGCGEVRITSLIKRINHSTLQADKSLSYMSSLSSRMSLYMADRGLLSFIDPSEDTIYIATSVSFVSGGLEQSIWSKRGIVSYFDTAEVAFVTPLISNEFAFTPKLKIAIENWDIVEIRKLHTAIDSVADAPILLVRRIYFKGKIMHIDQERIVDYFYTP